MKRAELTRTAAYDPETVCGYMDKVIASSDTLQAMLDDILRMSKLESGMTELDWIGAARAIRALDRSDAKSVPIFAISANSFPDDIKKSLDAGMNEHLPKPIRIDEVTAMIVKYKRNHVTKL